MPSLPATRSLPCALLLATLGAGGCAHTTPFMRLPPPAETPADGAIDHRLLLIGDAGDPDPDGEPALEALERRVRAVPARTTVVFLGDNVYETGMPEPTPLEGTVAEEALDEVLLNLFSSRRDAERRVKAQVKAADVPGARAIFVPGNHDWDQFGFGGWERVQELERYVDQLAEATDVRLDLYPGGGCPGPVTVDLGGRGRLVLLDTQWFLEGGDKPSPERNPTGCAQTRREEVLAALVAALGEAAREGRAAVVAGHHPLRSRGPHGGWIEPRVHLFPLTMFGSYVPFWSHWLPVPVLGSVMAWGRSWLSPNAQDFSSRANEEFRDDLLDAMDRASAAGAGPLLYACGHEHSLQVFRSDVGPRYLVVSGLGSSDKATPVRHDHTSLFAHSDPRRPGFVQVDFLRDGRVRMSVVESTPTARDGTDVWAHVLDEARPRRTFASAEP